MAKIIPSIRSSRAPPGREELEERKGGQTKHTDMMKI